MQIEQRQLIFGDHRVASSDPNPGRAPYVVAGKRMYVLGYPGAGSVAIGDEHLVAEMGGVWAHPIKVADDFSVTLCDAQQTPHPVYAATFTETLANVQWTWQANQLHIQRCDHVATNAPALVSTVTLRNAATATTGYLQVSLVFKFLGAWFGGMANATSDYWLDDNLVLGQARQQQQWGVAFGTTFAPVSHQIMPKDDGAVLTAWYPFTLAADQQHQWRFLLAAEHQHGWRGAAQQWHTLHSVGTAEPYSWQQDPTMHLHLTSSNIEFQRDVSLAQANLQLLHATYPDLGDYLLAGLPEYPQFFGCDTTYTVPGAVAAGFAPTTQSALRQLAEYAQRACGRVPHEITTNGRVFHPGNIQETPQFTLACWDYVRWTGDLDFARAMFPVCREGMLDLMPASCGPMGIYPLGDGMIERLGMGSCKLDSACYYYAGLAALSKLAHALDDQHAQEYQRQAEQLRMAIDRDWWMDEETMYADSMHTDGRLQLDGHWTVVLPVQLGIAGPERAQQVLDRIEHEWVNEWGLVHTRQHEELVWTLPTGLLALAAFAHGRVELGWRLAQNIAYTTHYGTMGTFKELIPEGLCFIQLWSAGLYLQTVFEGVLGLQPNAAAHELSITPRLPADLTDLAVHTLHVGQHRLDISIAAAQLRIDHHAGPTTLTVCVYDELFTLPVGQQLLHDLANERS